MNTYKATPTAQYNDQKKAEPVIFQAENEMTAKNWIINHCDCSYSWTYEKIA